MARVLVTGASGVFGREIIERLHARGHEVVGLSRSRPRALPDGVRFHAADITDRDAVARAVDGCDVVAHCAWAVGAVRDDDLERRINVGGTEHLLEAMRRTGTRRIVFASSSTAYGPRRGPGGDVVHVDESMQLAPHPDHPYARHKAEVEGLLAAAPVDAVTIRSAVVVGRTIDNRIWSALAAPVQIAVRGVSPTWQVVHVDDVGRFFVTACEGGPPGPVNLAAPGTFTMDVLARTLGRRLVTLPAPALRRAVAAAWNRGLLDISPAELDFMVAMPVMRTDRLGDAWGFECAWSGRDALDDTRLAVTGVVALGPIAADLPWRRRFVRDVPTGLEPPADGAPLAHAAPVGRRGEFDTPLDPRFPAYTSTNLGEILPGPATPLSLSVVGRALRLAGAATMEILQLGGVAGHEMRCRFQGTFGHRLFVNASGAIALGRSMPGWDEAAIVEQYVGRNAVDIDLGGDDVPAPPPRPITRAVRDGLGLGVRGVGLAAGYRGDVDELVRQTARAEQLASDPGSLPDARLEAVARVTCDLVTHGWRIAAFGAILAGVGETAAARLGAPGNVAGSHTGLPSGVGLAGVRRLADSARRLPDVVAVLESGGDDLEARVRRASAAFAIQLDEVLERFGHRGPAECELAARTFNDDPDFLLRTVAKSMTVADAVHPVAPSPPRGRAARTARRIADHFTGERERGRDRVVRLIWLLRGIVRERGRRLVDAGVLTDADDVCYLTFDELWSVPPDAAAIVIRRRAERARLAALRMPTVFSGTWHAREGAPPLVAGEQLQGTAASPGRTKGRVRVVDADTADDLEAGEVLVANVTDVGYTPLFGHAAAVVTDVGGVMSHAAVVAREFGIPAVVDTGDATARLTDGALVEVDGTEGTVTVVEG